MKIEMQVFDDENGRDFPIKINQKTVVSGWFSSSNSGSVVLARYYDQYKCTQRKDLGTFIGKKTFQTQFVP